MSNKSTGLFKEPTNKRQPSISGSLKSGAGSSIFKKRERWIVTRKTWRYMTDAGKLLIPESLRKGKDMKNYSQEDFNRLHNHFQRICDNQTTFIVWEGPAYNAKIQLAENRINKDDDDLKLKTKRPMPEITPPTTQTVQLRETPKKAKKKKVRTRRKSSVKVENLDNPEKKDAFFPSIYGTGTMLGSDLDNASPQKDTSTECNELAQLILPVNEQPPEGFKQVGVKSSSEFHNNLSLNNDGMTVTLPSGHVVQEVSDVVATLNHQTSYMSNPNLNATLDFDLIDMDTSTMDVKFGKEKRYNKAIQTEPLPQEYYELVRQEEEKQRQIMHDEARNEMKELGECDLSDEAVLKYIEMKMELKRQLDEKKAARFRAMNYDPTLKNIKPKYLYKDMTSKEMEIQAGDSLLHLLRLCKTSVDENDTTNLPSSDSLHFLDMERDYIAQLYCGDLAQMANLDNLHSDYQNYMTECFQTPPPESDNGMSSTSPVIRPRPKVFIPVTVLQTIQATRSPNLAYSSCNMSNSEMSFVESSMNRTADCSMMDSSMMSVAECSQEPAPSIEWTPLPNNTWMHVSGESVRVETTPIFSISKAEMFAIRKVGHNKLRSQFGIEIPEMKDKNSNSMRKLKHGLMKKRNRSKVDEKKLSVFGTTLSKCEMADSFKFNKNVQQSMTRKKSLSSLTSKKSIDDGNVLKTTRSDSRSSYVSASSEHSITEMLDNERRLSYEGSDTSDSMFSPTSSDRVQSFLMNNLNFGNLSFSNSNFPLTLSTVPAFIIACASFIVSNGLHTVGIFRISPSQKRMKQIREQLETTEQLNVCARSSIFDEETNVHDVSALLKQFLRELPEPLIPKHLHQAFLSIQGNCDINIQINGFQTLIQVMPSHNRDTLCILLNLLGKVAEHSEDSIEGISQNGRDDETADTTLPTKTGNRMDAQNLSTIFAPNIFHCFETDLPQTNVLSQSGDAQLPQTLASCHSSPGAALSVIKNFSDALLRKSSDVINSPSSSTNNNRQSFVSLLKRLIEYRKIIFVVQPNDLNFSYLYLHETYPNVVNQLLKARLERSKSRSFAAPPVTMMNKMKSDEKSGDKDNRQVSPRRNEQAPCISKTVEQDMKYIQRNITVPLNRFSDNSSSEVPFSSGCSSPDSQLRDRILPDSDETDTTLYDITNSSIGNVNKPIPSIVESKSSSPERINVVKKSSVTDLRYQSSRRVKENYIDFYRSNTDSLLETSQKALHSDSNTDLSKPRQMRYVRRRYTDTRHPTQELPIFDDELTGGGDVSKPRSNNASFTFPDKLTVRFPPPPQSRRRIKDTTVG